MRVAARPLSQLPRRIPWACPSCRRTIRTITMAHNSNSAPGASSSSAAPHLSQVRQYNSSPSHLQQSSPSISESFQRPEPKPPIHILGPGLIGLLMGFSLRTIPDPPPVTFLTHRQGLVQQFNEIGRVVELKRHKLKRTIGGFHIECTRDSPNPLAKYYSDEEGVDVAMGGVVGDVREGRGVTGFLGRESGPGQRAAEAAAREREITAGGEQASVEELAALIEEAKNEEQGIASGQLEKPSRKFRPAGPPIQNLIITVKAHQTVAALEDVIHRLTPDSEILIVQNGMGVLEEIMETYWPGGEGMPKISFGVVSHGLLGVKSEPFRAVQSGFGNLQIAECPIPGTPEAENPFWMKDKHGVDRRDVDPHDPRWFGQPRYITQQLVQCPDLDALYLPYADLLIAQLEKLATNAVINPLSVLLNVRNGAIFSTEHGIRSAKLLLYETSLIFRSMKLLAGLQGKGQIFSADRLFTRAKATAMKTAPNYSSMWQDVVLKGRASEIDYINGFLVKKAMEADVPCSLNYMLTELVRARTMACREVLEKDVSFRTEWGWDKRAESEKELDSFQKLAPDLEA